MWLSLRKNEKKTIFAVKKINMLNKDIFGQQHTYVAKIPIDMNSLHYFSFAIYFIILINFHMGSRVSKNIDFFEYCGSWVLMWSHMVKLSDR